MKPRLYFIWVLSLALALVGAAWGIAWWLQPLQGDLTRVGGFAERDFGHNAPQMEFHPPLSTYGNWVHPVDVLVIGDSFANSPVRQWQNWLVAQTGWRTHTLDKNKTSIEDLLASTLYQQTPPRIVIWNVVERDLLYEYGKADSCQPYTANPDQQGMEPLDRQPTEQQPTLTPRLTGWSGLNPGFTTIWLWKSFMRWLGLDNSKSFTVTLSRNDLFSSRAATQLLVYREDLLKRNWKETDLERIRCGFANLAMQFEANGKTRFVTALAPDKSSAYHPWLLDDAALPKSILPKLLEKFPVQDARLDKTVHNLIETGHRDVYLPNDTHWGAAGHQAVAEAIIKLMVSDGMVI